MFEKERREPAPPGTKPYTPGGHRGRLQTGWPRTLAAAVAGLVGVLGINFAVVVIGQAAAGLLGIELDMPVATVAGTGIVGVLLTVLAAPIIEETVFRGIWFGLLRRRFGFWESAILPSLAFGMLHGIAAGPAAFLSGLLLCFLYDRTGRLAAPILVHIANNLLVIAWPVSEPLVQSDGAVPAAALAAVASAAATLFVFRITDGPKQPVG